MIVLITGSSRGIGRHLSELLLDLGHTVLGLARHREDEGPSHPRYFPYSVDLTDKEALTSTLDSLLKVHPHIDGFVANAGMGCLGSLEQLSSLSIEKTLQLNLTAPLLIARHLLPVMKKQQSGVVIFVGSEAALQGKREGSVYCASKFGLRGAAQALRQECAKSGLRVSLINPGMVRTDFFHSLPIEPGAAPTHALKPDDVAQSILWVIQAPPHFCVDEINLSPLHHVIKKRSVKELA